MFDKGAAALEADTMISSEEEKKKKKKSQSRSDARTLALSAAPELSLEATKRRPLGGTRVWCRYLPRLSAEGRKIKRSQKDTRSGSRAAGEYAVIAHLLPLCDSCLIVPDDTRAGKPDTRAIEIS